MGHRLSAIALLTSLELCASAAGAQVPESVAVLMPPSLVIEPGFFQGSLELGLQNRSEAAITAWGVWIECPGERPRGRGSLRDGWSVLEKARRTDTLSVDDRAVVPAGQTRFFRLVGCGPKGKGVLPVQVTMSLVVLEDGRWMGEIAMARELFENRAKYRATWKRVKSIIEDVRATVSGREALLALKACLEPLATSAAFNAATDTLRNLRFALDDSRSQQQPPELWLQSFLDEAIFQVEASERHIRPTPEIPASGAGGR